MDMKKVVLVIVDISGYTQFIRSHKMSAVHAEEVVFELLEAVIDHADYPLTLNKLEGDAAFLYAELTDENQAEIARDVLKRRRNSSQSFTSAPASCQQNERTAIATPVSASLT